MQTIHFVAAAACLAAAASAQFNLVVPAGYAAVEGNANNSFPWGLAGTYPNMRHQQVYDSSNFTSQSISFPILIQGMKLRENGGGTHAGGVLYNNVLVQLSTAAVDHAAVTVATAWAGHHGPDLATVFNGNVTTLASAGTTPNNWIIDVPFTTPFLYDPTSGNDLVIDVDRPLVAGTSFFLDNVSATGVPAPLGSRVYSTTGYPNANGLTINYSLVAELTYVPAAGLYPSFNATPTNPAVNQQVQFTDNSYTSDPGGITAWAWDVNGDTIIDYTTQNPTHAYPVEGNYDVSLTVTSAQFGAQTMTRTGFITVDAVEASFTAQILPGAVVVFTDTSTGGPTSWAWDFTNDGLVDATTQGTAHVYPGPGQYTCRLTVTDAFSNSTTTQTLGIDIIPVPGFGSTFSGTAATRGFWFQTPTKFSVVSASVPDETNNGTQNVAIFKLPSAPPSYPTTITGDLQFLAQGAPSNAPVPCAVSFDAGDFVGVLGACGTTSMANSYGTPAGPFASSVLGQPTTLTRFGTQFNINTNASVGTLPLWQEPAAALSRVVLGVSGTTGVAYGTGTPSGAGPAAPTMKCTALPFLGQTATIDVTQNDNNVLSIMAGGLGRASIPSPFGNILVGNILVSTLLNGGAVGGPGTTTYSFAVPNASYLIGVEITFQSAHLLVGSGQVALSNGVELVPGQ